MEVLRRRLRASAFQACAAPPVPALLGPFLDELRALARGQAGDPEARHELRRQLRAFRYALEWRLPDHPSLEPLRKLAWMLGLYRDWLLFEAFLAKRQGYWARRGDQQLAAGADALLGEAALQRREADAALAPLAKPFLEAHRAKKGPGA